MAKSKNREIDNGLRCRDCEYIIILDDNIGNDGLPIFGRCRLDDGYKKILKHDRCARLKVKK